MRTGLGWAPEIPDHWTVVPLNYVAKMGTGHTPDRKKAQYWQDCAIPWVTIRDATRDPDSLAPLTDTGQKISELGMANSAAVLHSAGTVMLSRTASVGYSVLTAIPMATSQDFAAWSPGPSLDSRYLLLVLRAMKPEWIRLAFGSTHRTIYMPDLESLRVPLPPLREQYRIATFVEHEAGRIADILDTRRRQLAVLDSREASLLDRMIPSATDGVRVKHLADRITSGPRGWGDLVGETGSPFIRIANIPHRGIVLKRTPMAFIEVPSGTERERTRTRVGDVLISITADIGSVGVVDEVLSDGNVSQHIALVRPNVKCSSEWLAYAIKSPAVQEQLRSSSYGGTKIGLGLGDVSEIRLPQIELEEQLRVVATINDRMRADRDLRSSILRQIDLLFERRQALITAAVTGQVDTSEASEVVV